MRLCVALPFFLNGPDTNKAHKRLGAQLLPHAPPRGRQNAHVGTISIVGELDEWTLTLRNDASPASRTC